MGLNANNAPSGGIKIEPMKMGTYPTRLVHVIDLGLQPQKPYKGQEKPPVNKIALTYEFVDEFLKDEDGNEQEDKPRHLTESFPLYNLESEKAKSTARYNALDPQHIYSGDFAKLVSIPVMVTIIHNTNNGRTYENIADISPMREKDAEKMPDLVNDPKVFDLDDPDIDVFNSLPPFIKKWIVGNLEFEGSKLQKLLAEQPKEEKPNTEEATDDGENPY